MGVFSVDAIVLPVFFGTHYKIAQTDARPLMQQGPLWFAGYLANRLGTSVSDGVCRRLIPLSGRLVILHAALRGSLQKQQHAMRHARQRAQLTLANPWIPKLSFVFSLFTWAFIRSWF